MENNGQNPTLADVYDLLTNPEFSDPAGTIIPEMGMLGGPARSAAALMSTTPGDTLGGIMANALANMNWLESEAMRKTFGAADFSALDLNNGKTSVYFVLPPELLGVHQRALRLIVNTFVSAAMQGRKVPGQALTLFIFEEAYAMGTFDLLTKISAILRGYGARAWFIWQGKGQPDELYGKNAETFFGNAGQVQVFAINDVAGANYISERIGNWVRWRKRQVQTNQGMRAEWEPAGACSLRDGPEVNRITGREGRLQIVLNEGGDPFLLRLTSYRKMFKPGEYAPDPFEPGRESLASRLFQKLREVLS
jgi:type IV secretory pathway TraG/TraD family ATPase VirD4